jgi:NADPH2:quinone reductase
MRAVVLSRFGPPGELVLTEVPDPIAGTGQVVLAVEAASITFVETQLRSGHPPHPSMAPALPVILGNGVGGTVTSVGAGVDDALLGRHVVSTTGGSGGYAEQVAVNAADVIDIPAMVSPRDAAALLADGRTALALVAAAAVQPGEAVLVEAAAGGVGTLLVQLAAAARGRVVGAVGGPRKLGLARELGASLVVDYLDRDWPDVVRSQVGAINVVFDGVGGEIGRAAFGLLGEGGRCCSYGMASGQFAWISDDEAASRGIRLLRGVPVSPQRMRELTAASLTAAAAGTLRPVIGQTFSLEDAAAAHEAMETRATIGKTLLTVSSRA